MMKITHVSTSDLGHGAGISAYRLHDALRRIGQDSKMLVSQKQSSDTDVSNVVPNSGSKVERLKRRFEQKLELLLNRFGPQCVYGASTAHLLHNPTINESDIINFHNLHWDVGNFSLQILPILGSRVPIVWTLHDMWAFTGHCIYSFDCERWKVGCGKCPALNSYMPLMVDTTALLYKIKQQIYQRTDLVVVAPSKWMQNVASQSPLFDGKRIFHIPYGVNQDIYRSVPKPLARQFLGIEPDKRVILFAASSRDDIRKGYQYFEESMLPLEYHLPGTLILSLGKGGVSNELKSKFQVIEMGYLQNERLIASVYAAADLMILPTIADNLPNTVLESMACGTPVVGFDVGGVKDMIQHMQTGYIAKCKDVDDLTFGMKTLLQDQASLERIQRKCVEIIAQNFSYQLSARRYLEIYQKLLNESKSVSIFE
jgi:glycosyltransferase involved in cell wall biosynthesis